MSSLVGDIGLDLDRADFYQKELDFFISTSYGPGRYDQAYEEHGLDYPVGLRALDREPQYGRVPPAGGRGTGPVAPLVGATFPLDEAPTAYEAVRSGSPRPVIVLLAYQQSDGPDARRVANPSARPGKAGAIGVAVVGAGSFAKSMHLPHIQALRKDVRLEAIVSRTGPNAVDTARQFGATYATTEFQEVLDDDRIELVVITTRHDTHARLALQALRAGKHVLVEKPMVLTREELNAITTFFAAPGKDPTPILLTGFNRRFSPYGQRLAELVAGRTNPMILDYRMNAGLHPTRRIGSTRPEGGGRNLGEACHIYDLFTFLTGARTVGVSATSIRPSTDYYSQHGQLRGHDQLRGRLGGHADLHGPRVAGSSQGAHSTSSWTAPVLLLDDYQRLDVAGQTSARAQHAAPARRASARSWRRLSGHPPGWRLAHPAVAAGAGHRDRALRVQDLITGSA